MSSNGLSSEEQKLVFETISKMGLFWQISLILPIIFWIGFAGIDFLNLSGFLPFIEFDYIRWIYLFFCLIYISFFSSKYFKVQNNKRPVTTWDLNKPVAESTYFGQISKDETSFTIISSYDILQIFFFCVSPCVFLVFGFFLFLRNDFDIFTILCIGLPLFVMFIQVFSAFNVVKYSKEVNKFVEPATKRFFIYAGLSIILILVSFLTAFFLNGFIPQHTLVQTNQGNEYLMVFNLDSNKIANCLIAGEISHCVFEERRVAKVVDENELIEIIHKKNFFGLDNVELFLVSLKEQDYKYGKIVITRNKFNFTGVCLPGDGSDGDYFDYVAPTWRESKLWNRVQLDEFKELESKLWDSNITYYENGCTQKWVHDDFMYFSDCLYNREGLNSVCCLGVFE